MICLRVCTRWPFFTPRVYLSHSKSRLFWRKLPIIVGFWADSQPPKPMLEAGHDGLWYWIAARKYAQKNQNWGAWFYYRTAAYYLSPVDFLSSPNLEKLQKEEDKVHPDGLPATATTPLMLNAQGMVFRDHHG